jgi:Fructose-2,6-bisphosphatase
MKFYFVRHGESAANLEHTISNRALPHALTAAGRAQVQSLAQSLAGHSFAGLYTSPIPRARETAALLAQHLGGQPVVTNALREIDMGELEGRSDPETWRRHDEIYQRWWFDQDDEASLPGGESFTAVKSRFLPLIDQLVEDESLAQAEILLVGHAGLYSCMLPVLFKNVPGDFAQSHIPGFGSLVVAESRVNGLTCLSWDGLTDFAPQY